MIAPASWLKFPRLSVPPSTVSAPVAASVLLAPMIRVPAETVVPPLKVFAPESVSVPAPDLASAVPTPERMAEIVPLSAVTLLRAMVPPLSVPPATVTALAIVWLPRLSVPPVLTVTVPEPKAAALPATRVPALTTVLPEKVLAPERVTEPPVDFVAVTAPARMAEAVPDWRS